MPRQNIRFRIASYLQACTAALLLTTAPSAVASDGSTSKSSATKRGVAVYASYTDTGYANEAATRLQNLLQSEIEINAVVVDGTPYKRLQSVELTRSQAEKLVSRAKAAGYSAWYVSSAVSGRVQSVSGTQQPAPAVIENAAPVRPQILLSQTNPELEAMLPEGPLLGEIYPPRTPVAD